MLIRQTYLLTACAAVLVFGLPTTTRAEVRTGEPAPDFTAKGADGREIKLSDFRGKVVLLDVWATWCGPCIAAQPHLSALAEKHAADGLVVLAVCADDTPENFATWARREAKRFRFLAAHDPAGRSGWESSPLKRGFAVKGFPTMVVIDREGRFVGSTIGGGDRENLNVIALLAQAGLPVDKSRLPDALRTGPVVQKALPMRSAPVAAAPVTSPGPEVAPNIPLFKAALGKMKIGDPLPEFLLMVGGHPRQLASFAGRPLVLCLVFNAIPSSAYEPKMEAVAARYQAAYGVQTLVVKVNTMESGYRAWLGATDRAVSFLRGWDPAGRFVPSRPESAQQEHPAWEARTLIKTFMGEGASGTPSMPAYLIVGADGRFGGWLTGHPWFEDGVANLLLHSGVPLAPEHQPKHRALPEDFLPATPAVPAAKLAAGGMMPDFEFVDVGGRKIKLSELRGKVVLVDFWATWCGPCKAEIPNVKNVYAAYHGKGFEVVGIALENAGLRPNDTPEQAVAKLEKAKKALVDFIAREAMPWPQQFDGKYWKNEISTRFGIAAIPAMFLIDQQGKLVTTEARGERLDAEVRRLLKL